MEIKGTKSEQNLKAALAGESIARNKYTYYAMAARKEGQDKIAESFERMAKNEMMHAKFWFELLNGKPKNTLTNLQDAAKGELQEWHSMYPEFARQAREDGLEELALMFERVASIERDHERQFIKLCADILKTEEESKPEEGVAVSREGYRCMFCGAVFSNRPDVCEVCGAIGSFEPCSYEE